MNRTTLFFLLFLVLASCNAKKEALADLKGTSPQVFMPELTPEGMIIHSGSFSPDLNQYYFTLSDTLYSRFDTHIIERIGEQWSAPKPAFFNSEFSDHGVKFSPDGQEIYFASTRPTGIEGISDTWHLWEVHQTNHGWSAPTFLNIPGLENKLVSHPTITEDGILYFHASNLDYSDMRLYSSQLVNDKYIAAEVLKITENSLACTPFVTADGTTLIYAQISDELDLMISYKRDDSDWSQPTVLDSVINSNGQGNPYLTPDGKHLYYTSSPAPAQWQINKVSTQGWLK